MSDDQPRWEEMEEWLVDHEDEEFTVYDLAASKGICPSTGTLLIQGYLAAQRRPDSPTLYVLKRKGRTRDATWSVGIRQVDARLLDLELYEDIVVKVNRTWRPDTKRLSEINPQLAKRYERKVEAMVGGALVVLRTVLDDALNDE